MGKETNHQIRNDQTVSLAQKKERKFLAEIWSAQIQGLHVPLKPSAVNL